MAGGAITDDRDDDPATQAMPVPGSGDNDNGGWLLAGRYRVAERIGTGGMAEVFRAHDELLARDVAVKVFRSHADPADSAAGVQRQEIELQALAQLSHPNLITLFDGSIAPVTGPAFLVMELIQGPSLAAQIAEAPLSDAQARETGAQIADALAYVHSRSMVHRDIKPANILLGTDSTTGDATVRARLSDFGIVRLLGSDHLTSVNFMVGTASYLAPEQARGSEVGPPADVYSLGLVLIEALTGQRSYPGPAMEAVMARLDHPPEIPANLPSPWPNLLRSMTDLDPARRPSAAAVVRALQVGSLADAPTAFVPPVVAAIPDEPATRTTALPVSPLADLPLAPAAAVTPARSGYVGWLVAAVIAVVAIAAVAFVLISKGSSNSPATPVAPVSSAAPTTSAETPTVSDTPTDETTSDEPTTSDETTTAATTPAPTTSATSSTPAPTTSAPTTSATTSTPATTTANTSVSPGKTATTTAEGEGKVSTSSSATRTSPAPTATATTSTPKGAPAVAANGRN